MPCKQVVLIDDNDALREAFVAFLSGRGYQVASFASGKEAEPYLSREAESIGLVVTEWEPPTADGFQLLRARGTDPNLSGFALVVLTARLDASTLQVPGAEAVLHKPVTTDTLMSVIQRYCGTPLPWSGTHRPRTLSGVRVVRGADFDAWDQLRKKDQSAE